MKRSSEDPGSGFGGVGGGGGGADRGSRSTSAWRFMGSYK